MLKQTLTAMALWCAMSAFAAVEVNTATEAELDGVKGIGPSLSSKILKERKKASFQDWPDFIARVRGVRAASAAKLSAQGLTVNGATWTGSAPKADKP